MKNNSKKYPIRKFLFSVLIFLAALILILEEWVWNSVKPGLEYFSKFRIIQKIENLVKNLNAYSSLTLFIVPFALTHLTEFWAIGIFTLGKIYLGISIYIISKIIGFMLLTRIFTLTKPKIMTVSWFKNSYYWYIDKKELVYLKLEEIGVWKKIKKIKLSLKLSYQNIKEKIRINGNLPFFNKFRSKNISSNKDKIKNWFKKISGK